MKDKKKTLNRERDHRLFNSPLDTKEDYIVEGYCALWQPYKIAKIDGVDYFEQIHQEALDDADMSDIIFQLNHEGTVYARTSNKSLTVTTDNIGIYIRADLSSTQKSRDIYEEIEKGLLVHQSWAFSVDKDYYEPETRTRHITKVGKVYDASVVAKPANGSTSITAREKQDLNARTYFDGAINRQESERTKRIKSDYFNLKQRIESL